MVWVGGGGGGGGRVKNWRKDSHLGSNLLGLKESVTSGLELSCPQKLLTALPCITGTVTMVSHTISPVHPQIIYRLVLEVSVSSLVLYRLVLEVSVSSLVLYVK